VRYLLDSNFVIDLLNAAPAAIDFAQRHATMGFCISTITAMEVRHGLVREGTAALERFDDFLRVTAVLEVTLPIALQCGDLRALLARRGRHVRTRSLDLIIACTAIHHGLTLVSDDERGFRDIPGLALLH
jgi:tRNA(fMet)-specific endonuclease VapC